MKCKSIIAPSRPRHAGCRWRGNATYRLRVVKVLHDNSFDIAIIILEKKITQLVSFQPPQDESGMMCKPTLSAFVIIVRSSTGLRPAKSTTCDTSSSEGSMEAMMSSSSTGLYSDSYKISVAEEGRSRNGSAISRSGLSFNRAGQLTLAPEASSSTGKRHEQRYG